MYETFFNFKLFKNFNVYFIFINIKVDSFVLEDNGLLSRENIDRLKQFHLFGLSIPKMFNGLGLNRAEWSHVCEAIALDSSLWCTLTTHQIMAAKVSLNYELSDFILVKLNCVR